MAVFLTTRSRGSAVPSASGSAVPLPGGVLQGRQWFQPLAPTMTMDAVPEIFDDPLVESPFMSFAPKLKADIEKRFPAIHHIDGTARPQVWPGGLWVPGLLARFWGKPGVRDDVSGQGPTKTCRRWRTVRSRGCGRGWAGGSQCWEPFRSIAEVCPAALLQGSVHRPQPFEVPHSGAGVLVVLVCPRCLPNGDVVLQATGCLAP